MNSIFSKKTKEENTTYDTMSSLSHTKWNCKCRLVNVSVKYIRGKQKDKKIEKQNIKISIKDLLEDPFKNIRKDFVEKGEYLAVVTGYTDNGIFANITVCTLPTWLDRPPLPKEKVIVKIYKIVTEKRKIYSSLVKIIGSDTSE